MLATSRRWAYPCWVTARPSRRWAARGAVSAEVPSAGLGRDAQTWVVRQVRRCVRSSRRDCATLLRVNAPTIDWPYLERWALVLGLGRLLDQARHASCLSGGRHCHMRLDVTLGRLCRSLIRRTDPQSALPSVERALSAVRSTLRGPIGLRYLALRYRHSRMAANRPSSTDSATRSGVWPTVTRLSEGTSASKLGIAPRPWRTGRLTI